MMKNYALLFTITLLIFSIKISAQTEWTGPTTSFSKSDFADWTLEGNQDRITPNVWITRADNQGIFNIAQEASFGTVDPIFSPLDTEWALGTIADGVGTLTYNTWVETVQSNPPGSVGQNMVLHLITDDIYIDIVFTSWTQGGAGGGFSYDRSTEDPLSIDDFETNGSIKLFPNPSRDFVEVSGLTGEMNYKIFSILGVNVAHGIISNNTTIDIKDLDSGVYFVNLGKSHSLRLIKQ